jgi:PhnB protein
LRRHSEEYLRLGVGKGRLAPSSLQGNRAVRPSHQETLMELQPYLFFDGLCEDAVNFYQKTLGAEVEMMMRFKDSPEPPQPGTHPPGQENKIMHSSFRIGDTVVMASDGYCQGKPSFQGFALALQVRTEAEAERLFGALADGGKVQAPLTKTFFSPRFGMVADRFGVNWMVVVGEKPA